MIGIDTNILVRYFAQDDEEQSLIASKMIESLSDKNQGFISLVVIVELYWIMRTVYNAPKEKIIDIIDKLIRVDVFSVENPDVVAKALKIYEKAKADFSDCLIERSSANYDCRQVFTFDRNAAKTAQMVLLENA